MKWMIKKYCFNVSSNTACMQVVLKPHEDEEVPLKLRLFWGATDSDSTVKHLGKKQFHKALGSDVGKQKKKYPKDDKYYKSRNAFDQFYKHLSKRKMKLLHSPQKSENNNSTKKLLEKSLFAAMSEPLAYPVSKNPKQRVTHGTNTKRKFIKETPTTFSGNNENGSVPEISSYKIMHGPFKKEIDIIYNEEEATKSERNANEEDENEIKERIKRAAKKGKKGKKSTIAATKEPATTKKPAVTKNDEYEGDDEEDSDDSDSDEEVDDDDDEEEEEGEQEYRGENEEEGGGDAGIEIKPNQYPVVVVPGDVRLAEHHGADSSAADTSEQHDGPAQGVGENYYYQEAQVPDEGQAFYNAHDPAESPVGALDHDAHHEGAFYPGAHHDWNRCQLPPPRKTSEVLCKVLPQKMVCKLYCIHGHTFPEGIIRQTDCELTKGAWTKKFDECLPFVDCTLRLRTAGYLKCTTNTVQVGPRCQVECQKYAEQAATEKKTHQCDATGRWDPPLPHCVVREGIDVVQPPSTMHQGKIDYPQ